MRIGLSAHFVYVGMNLIRRHLHQIIETEVEPRQREAAFRAVEKILDLNLDIIARTYHEEELRRVFLSQKLDSLLIRFSQRFTFGLNILLVVGLLGLSLGAVGLVVQDVIHIVQGNLTQGLVGAMGSVLILWVVIELLDMEIDRLRGGAFKLQLFVGLALVAFIRKVLVSSLASHDLWTEGLYLAGILVCGVIFWLVSRAEAAQTVAARCFKILAGEEEEHRALLENYAKKGEFPQVPRIGESDLEPTLKAVTSITPDMAPADALAFAIRVGRVST